jgi:hypothetical protein
VAKSSPNSSPLPCNTRYLLKMCNELNYPSTIPSNAATQSRAFSLPCHRVSTYYDTVPGIMGLHSASGISRRPTKSAGRVHHHCHHIMYHPSHLGKIQCVEMTVALSLSVSPLVDHAALRSGPKTLHSQVMPPRRPSAQIESSDCAGLRFSILGLGSKVVWFQGSGFN